MKPKSNVVAGAFSWRALVRALAMALVLLPILAEDGAGGGDGGIINLPGVRDRNNNNLIGYRMRISRDDFRPGIVLKVADDMRSCVAVLRAGDDLVPIVVTDGYLTLTGDSLAAILSSGVQTLGIDLCDVRNNVLTMTLALDPKSTAFTLTVW